MKTCKDWVIYAPLRSERKYHIGVYSESVGNIVHVLSPIPLLVLFTILMQKRALDYDAFSPGGEGASFCMRFVLPISLEADPNWLGF